MKLRKVIFSYDRPMQLQGLCLSVLQNSDLQPADLCCLCRSSSAHYQMAYDAIREELGVQIVHENRIIPGIDLRQLFALAAWMPRVRGYLAVQMYRLTTPKSLPQRVLELTQDVDTVSLAVDDMVYFRESNFAFATAVLADNPEVCVWSWRLGIDRYPRPDNLVQSTYWTVPHRNAPPPYSYIFHTDGSVYRRADLEQWLRALPQNEPLTLNMVEQKLWNLYQAQPERLNLGPLHAGPLKQTCVTWQINRVSPTATANFHAEAYTDPKKLCTRYLEGTRLDYSNLYGRGDWLTQLNCGTHVAPTQEAVEAWYSMVKDPK